MTNLTKFLMALALLVTRQGQADVVYNSLLGDLYNGSAGHRTYWANDLTFPQFSEAIGLAVPFTVPIGLEYHLDSVTLALSHYGGATNLEVLLLGNNNGVPGDILELLAINPVIGSGTPSPSTFVSSLDPVLSGGETYWLLAQPHELNITNQVSNSGYNWYINLFDYQGPLARHHYDFEANTWEPAWDVRNSFLPAFRIEGTLMMVPEPSTWSLLALGTVAFLAIRRRGK